jgi:transcriptional regulator of acetoin/glycerol metabolism
MGDSNALTAKDLRFDANEPPPRATMPTSLTLEEVERQHIEAVLGEEGGRVESAARRLGVPRSSLYQKLKRFGIALSRV